MLFCETIFKNHKKVKIFRKKKKERKMEKFLNNFKNHWKNKILFKNKKLKIFKKRVKNIKHYLIFLEEIKI